MEDYCEPRTADSADDLLTREQSREKDGTSLNGVRKGSGNDGKPRLEIRKTIENIAWGVWGKKKKKKWP